MLWQNIKIRIWDESDSNPQSPVLETSALTDIATEPQLGDKEKSSKKY